MKTPSKHTGNTSSPSKGRDEAGDILKKYWGYDDFRGIQREIIEDIMSGRDVLGLMPTGGGKSITFQVPALALDGICIVVTPLIALMKDQVQNLRKRHIKADAIYSGLSHNKQLEIMENAVYGGLKLLYVSPERLESELFRAKLSHMNVSFFTVDEAHCICQWGYDFRPSYLKIGEARQIHPQAPILALTATATPAVVEDIQQQLLFRAKNCRRMSFKRPNLSYLVQTTDDKIASVIGLLNENPGSAIVYTSSREKTSSLADALRTMGFTAEAYNAGLTDLHRDVRQQKWTSDRTRVMVATNAFGMGIDKPDVRLVIHFDCPSSLEAYFQEAGRAGRDGKAAKAVLLATRQLRSTLLKKINTQYPDEEFILGVYERVSYFYEIGVGYGRGFTKIFDMTEFCRAYNYFPTMVSSALHILSNAGYLNYDDERDSQSKVRFIVDRDELYSIGELPTNANELILTMLRNYTGMFTDYQTINEEILGQHLNITYEKVYELLKELSRRGIIRYIPRNTAPMLQFLIDRVDSDEFYLPKRCYKLLKTHFKQRIEKIIEYATSTDECRLRLLLNYFGEKATEDCGQCDVCQSTKSSNVQKDSDSEAVQQFILQILSDGNLHHISEFISPTITDETMMNTIRHLLHEEKIHSKGLLLSLRK